MLNLGIYDTMEYIEFPHGNVQKHETRNIKKMKLTSWSLENHCPCNQSVDKQESIEILVCDARMITKCRFSDVLSKKWFICYQEYIT